MNQARAITAVAATLLIPATLAGATQGDRAPDVFDSERLAGVCTQRALQAVADSTVAGIAIKEIANMSAGLELPGGSKYFPATDSLPAYCQVSGSFVTNPETGKTANFLATLPENWNGKYLQYGCFGHCGFFALNDATMPLVTIIAQGKPGDSLRKGYASFGTDGGHEGPERRAWAVKDSGELDGEAMDDFLYRSTKLLAKAAKEFTAAFYSQLSDETQQIARSYFTGCSGGGRDGLVAASYFPEEFDGIIVGSPYANMVGVNLHRSGQEMALRRENAAISSELAARIDPIVKVVCDRADGVEDGLIQNPAACEFDPARDLPNCAADKPGDNCFTPAQIEAISVSLTALTDESGNLLQPGMSVSELQLVGADPEKPLDNETLRILAYNNDPQFSVQSLIRLAADGEGDIPDFRAVVPRVKADQAMDSLRMGIGSFPENADRLIRENRKLLIWHNLSDQSLTPFMSYNNYDQLAARHGGYEKVQNNVRLFTMPGTTHCSMSGVGPTVVDVLSAMEEWVEEGKAPNGLIASKYPDTENGGKDYSQPPSRTMPLCKYPEMAHYKGEGDVNDAANWHCPAGDQSMLQIGSSGKRAGVNR